MATDLEKQLKVVEDKILEVEKDIKDIKAIPVGDPRRDKERDQLPGLQSQLAELRREKNNLQAPGAT